MFPFHPMMMPQFMMDRKDKSDERLPVRVRMAYEFISHCQEIITDPEPAIAHGGGMEGKSTIEVREGRKLDKDERAAYNSALILLTDYFRLETTGKLDSEIEKNEETNQEQWTTRPPIEEGSYVYLDLLKRKLALAVARENNDVMSIHFMGIPKEEHLSVGLWLKVPSPDSNSFELGFKGEQEEDDR